MWRRAVWAVGTLASSTALVVGLSTFVGGCGDDECLVWGENCTQQYLDDNYGTTDIHCCEGQCTDHGSGILTCGS